MSSMLLLSAIFQFYFSRYGEILFRHLNVITQGIFRITVYLYFYFGIFRNWIFL
jgi:hypothetical protein